MTILEERDDLTDVREQLDPLSYEEIEGLIGRSNVIYDIAGYKAYLAEIWNEQDFNSEHDKQYCWNLIRWCDDCTLSLRQIAGFGLIDIRQPIGP